MTTPAAQSTRVALAALLNLLSRAPVDADGFLLIDRDSPVVTDARAALARVGGDSW